MAKTAAERQKAYRERRSQQAGEQRVNTWIAAHAIRVLNSLALRHGVTQKIMLERLILEFDDGRVALKRAATGATSSATSSSSLPATPRRRNTSTPTGEHSTAATGQARPRRTPRIPRAAQMVQTSLWDEPVVVVVVATSSGKKPRNSRKDA